MIGAKPPIFIRRVLASRLCHEVDTSKSPWFDRMKGIRFSFSIARIPMLLFRPHYLWWTALFTLCLILIAPLAAVDVPPLLDYPNHLARAYVLAHGRADLHLSQMYAPHWAIIPNLAIDLILPPLLLILPVHTAGRVLLAVTLVLPVIGTILYSQSVFGRRSYWPLAGCLVAYNGLFLLGFVNFQLGIGLALICAAAWRRLRETRPVAAVALGMASAVVLFFSHLMGLLFFLILLLSHEVERFRNGHQQGHSRTASLRRAAWSIPIILVPSALYATSAFGDQAADISWNTWPEKLIHAVMSVVNYNLPLDIATACFIAAALLTLATLRLIVAPLGSLIALAAVAVLFSVCPFGFKGTGYVDARFAVMFGFLLFGAILPVRLPKKSALLVGFAMVALFGLRTAQTAAVWNAHNRDLDQLRSAMSAVEPGSRVLLAAVSPEEASPTQQDFLRRRSLSDGSRLDGHTAALLLIERHAFWPFLFANREQQPVELRSPYREIAQRTAGIPDVRLLSAPIYEPGDVARFPLEGQWSCCYDYVLLMAAGNQPEFHHPNLESLYQSDYASVFRVKQHAPFVPVGDNGQIPAMLSPH
jgi:hypothetical protein